MVVVEVIETGEIIDVTNAKITYVKQVSNLADITKTNASYSWSFEIPKTPTNTKIFKGLGIVGDASIMPYKRVYCRLTDNGVAIVSKGLLNIKETAKDYKAHIQEGIIEFYKDISNDIIGETIDLSELDHENSTNNIINSFSQDTYRYIIADYNGPVLPNHEETGITNLNPNALVPSVNLKWLWDKIFEYYGWTYSGNFDIADWWMTYPTALPFDIDDAELVADLSSSGQTHSQSGSDAHALSFPDGSFNPEFISATSSEFTVQSTQEYMVTFNALGSADWYDGYTYDNGISDFDAYLIVDGNVIDSINSSNSNASTNYLTIESGQTVSVEVRLFRSGGYTDVTFNIDSAFLQISVLGISDVYFRDAFIKYKTKDFFKEIMIRLALTAFPDVDHKNIHFVSLNERLDADVVDWSDKYIERKSESYLYENYAQNNYLKHKYNNEDDEGYFDGNIVVPNENLEDEKDLFKSQTYAPLEGFTQLSGTTTPPYNAPRLKMYELETELDENGDVIGSYEGLKDRFYIIKSSTRVDDLYIMNEHVEQFPVAEIAGMTFKRIVENRYNNTKRLLNGTRVHKIDLKLSRWDVATLDLNKVYYFRQEASYYLLNKLTWKNGEITTGEFVKIVDNPDSDFIDPVPSEEPSEISS